MKLTSSATGLGGPLDRRTSARSLQLSDRVHLILLGLTLACRGQPATSRAFHRTAQADSASAAISQAPDTLHPPGASAPAPGDTLALSSDGRLVVAVTTSTQGVTFDPILFLPRDGGPRAYPPGLDTGLAAFQRLYADSTRPYTLLEGGRPIGLLRPTGAFESSCVGFTGTGVANPALPVIWAGLGVSGGFPAPRWRRRDLTPPELAALRRLARPLLLQLEAQPTGADSAVLDRGFAYELPADSARILAASLYRDEPRAAGISERLSVFLIAQGIDPDLTPTFTWAHGGIEEDHQERRFLDAADLDGDGQLEFITSITYYESIQYWIVTAGGVEWPAGAAAGC